MLNTNFANTCNVFVRTNLAASRMTQDDLRRLQNAIQQLHSCQSAHVATIPLTEQRSGKILWQGEVQIFDLHGHRTAQRCYAWMSRNSDGKLRHTVVLEVPHVDSPRSAVRAALSGKLQIEGKRMRSEKTWQGTLIPLPIEWSNPSERRCSD
jgi:lysophospholipid acyltransferase (LPLAT)-like uncharacterized protein